MSSPSSFTAAPSWSLAYSTLPASPARVLPHRHRPPGDAAKAPLIAFCHLGWDGVWQRPQQLLSRLARSRDVLFVETYCRDVPVSENHSRTAADHPRVTILEMHLPARRWSDGAFIDLERRRLLMEFCRRDRRFASPVLWFNDPMAVTAFAGQCAEQAIVYDCMDELAQFKGAPPELQERERQLLACADVVFCGGRKMRDKRLPLNRNSHFYGTGVDCDHFGRAAGATLPIDAEIAALPGKVLGYFGVVDERIDYALLEALAAALPECTIAMVGPVAKVEPSGFPRAANLRWLGRRAYADLPAITKGFAVCLMPFARNAATEYINPTKALEYMAAGRPIVSTAIDEVKSNFSSVCRIAATAREFIDWCRREAAAPSRERIARGRAMAAENTWETITGKMDDHVTEAIQARESAKADRIPLRAASWGMLGHV